MRPAERLLRSVEVAPQVPDLADLVVSLGDGCRVQPQHAGARPGRLLFGPVPVASNVQDLRPGNTTDAPVQRRAGEPLTHRDAASSTPLPSGLIDDVLERLEGLVKPLLASTVLLVVGLRSNVAKQLFKIVLAGGQHGAVGVIGEACSKDEPFASGVDET